MKGGTKPKQKQMHRNILRKKFNMKSECRCRGFIKAFSTIDYTFGMNSPNKTRILLIDVEVDEIKLKHIWIECEEMNSYPQWMWVAFDATVSVYRKKNGIIGYNLVNIQNVELEELKNKK